MVLFVVANMLFVLVRMITAVPSVSVPLIFARQLFVVVLSLGFLFPSVFETHFFLSTVIIWLMQS